MIGAGVPVMGGGAAGAPDFGVSAVVRLGGAPAPTVLRGGLTAAWGVLHSFLMWGVLSLRNFGVPRHSPAGTEGHFNLLEPLANGGETHHRPAAEQLA